MGTEIQNLSLTPSGPPSTWEVVKTYLSEVDWKTHSLVVLSYTLIGIGVALACSSFYFAFVFHPMIAVASPFGTTMSGIFIQTLIPEQQKQLPGGGLAPAKPVEYKPMGIRNGGSNCWLISALQMFFHIPVFKKLLLEASQEEKESLAPLLKALDDYQNGRPVIAQDIRNWLNLLNPKQTDNNIFKADDPNNFIDTILAVFSEKKPPLEMQADMVFIPDDNPDFRLPLENSEFHDFRNNIPLTPDLFKPTHHMETAVNNLFYFTEPLLDYILEGTKKNGKKETKASLSAPPEHLSFTISGNYTIGQSAPKPILGGMSISLNKGQVGQDSVYICDAFIKQVSANHYVAYFLENGKWWEANDGREVEEITLEEAAVAQRNATFVHYVKGYSHPPRPAELSSKQEPQS